MDQTRKELQFGVELEMLLIPQFDIAEVKEIQELREKAKPVEPSSEHITGTEVKEWISDNEKSDTLREQATHSLFKTLIDTWDTKVRRKDKSLFSMGTENNFRGNAWTLTTDPTVKPSPKDDDRDNQFGVEIKSPIIYIGGSREQTAQTKVQIETLYNFLTTKTLGKCKIEDTTTLAHEIRRICCAAYYWEPVIRLLVPEHRWGSDFAEDMGAINSKCFKLESKYQRATENWGTYAKLPQEEFEKNLASIMNIQLEKDLIETFFDNQRNWAWNFKPLTTYGTIEFRKPPMSNDVDDVLCWVELVTCTALAACNMGNAPQSLLKLRRSCAGFKLFIGDQRTQFMDPSISKLSTLFDKALAFKDIPMGDFDMRPGSAEDKLSGVFSKE